MKEYKKPLAEVFELRVTENIAAPVASAGKAAKVTLKWQNKVPMSLYSALAHTTSEPTAKVVETIG
ncbi:MAG: hypothetical protein IKW59_07910 [Clostridia bacterium]|nr:hypothetical protein [Clostridia bacterium]